MFALMETFHKKNEIKMKNYSSCPLNENSSNQCVCLGLSQWYHWLVTFVPLVPMALPFLPFAPFFFTIGTIGN